VVKIITCLEEYRKYYRPKQRKPGWQNQKQENKKRKKNQKRKG